MKIQVHIERLVLDGLPVTRRDGAAIQAAVETELARLFSENGAGNSIASGGAIATLAAPHLQLVRGSDPAALGRQIAQSVYGGIGR